MKIWLRYLAVVLAASSLVLVDGSAFAQPKDKDRKEQKEEKGGAKDRGGKPDKEDRGQGGQKEQKPKKAKHQNGKQLAGDKVKKNGKHELHKNGKHTAFIDVQDGKIRAVNVKHADKGDVPVKKYKTKRKPPNVAGGPAAGIQPVSLILTQAATSLGEVWIGYAYIDEWGEEVIYWFPYEMIYDGDTGAIEYVPVY